MKPVIYFLSLIISLNSFSAIRSIKLDSKSLRDIKGATLSVCMHDMRTLRQNLWIDSYDDSFGIHITRIFLASGTELRYKSKVMQETYECELAKRQAALEGKKIEDLLKTIRDEAITFENGVCIKTMGYMDIDDETNIASRIQTVKIKIDCP